MGAEAASASSGPRPTGYLGGQPLPLAVCQAQPPGAPRGSRRLAGGRITGQPRGRGPAERRCGRRGARGGPAGSRGQAASRDANARAAGGLSGGLCRRTPQAGGASPALRPRGGSQAFVPQGAGARGRRLAAVLPGWLGRGEGRRPPRATRAEKRPGTSSPWRATRGCCLG